MLGRSTFDDLLFLPIDHRFDLCESLLAPRWVALSTFQQPANMPCISGQFHAVSCPACHDESLACALKS